MQLEFRSRGFVAEIICLTDQRFGLERLALTRPVPNHDQTQNHHHYHCPIYNIIVIIIIITIITIIIVLTITGLALTRPVPNHDQNHSAHKRNGRMEKLAEKMKNQTWKYRQILPKKGM